MQFTNVKFYIPIANAAPALKIQAGQIDTNTTDIELGEYMGGGFVNNTTVLAWPHFQCGHGVDHAHNNTTVLAWPHFQCGHGVDHAHNNTTTYSNTASYSDEAGADTPQQTSSGIHQLVLEPNDPIALNKKYIEHTYWPMMLELYDRDKSGLPKLA